MPLTGCWRLCVLRGLSGAPHCLPGPQVYYDKRDHNMKPKDKSRVDDFISISGTKMRTLAALGAVSCPPEIPKDLLAAKCIPPGFMVEGGWAKMVDYYQNKNTKEWVSRPCVAMLACCPGKDGG